MFGMAVSEFYSIDYESVIAEAVGRNEGYQGTKNRSQAMRWYIHEIKSMPTRILQVSSER